MFAGKRVLVVGAGVTGRSVVAALADLGAHVTVTVTGDRVDEIPGVPTVAGLTAPPEHTDLVVTSPGLPPATPLLVAAAEAGIDVIGDVELAWRLRPVRSDPEGDRHPGAYAAGWRSAVRTGA